MSEDAPTGAMNSSSREWDAETYDRVSDPQFSWGMEVLERLELRGDEVVVDAGCGSGRVSAELKRRLPDGRLIAVDGSSAMVEKAHERLGDDVEYLVADLVELQLPEPVDLVFSTATFHWILDHDQLFRVLYRALKPGGRIVAQCGGGPNLNWIRSRADELMKATRFAPFFKAWKSPWLYAPPEETAMRLKAAGFVAVETWLESTPTPFDNEQAYRAFTAHVVMRPYLQAIEDDARREEFLTELTAQAAHDDPPFTLDYWRLNINARKS